ncbi:MAG TPA: hypothetical protein DEG69_15645 [Flavobacteriaceae bacterium]|nr:hypothetical protein [Flavobacteriaceae bacterium]
MLTDLSIAVNTHSSSSDIWPLFFSQLENYFLEPSRQQGFKGTVYVFTDDCVGIPTKYKSVLYNKKESFRTQYLECIKEVEDEFVLYLNEDYILYDSVNLSKISEYLKILNADPNLSFIRFTRGPNITDKKLSSDLFYLSHDQPFFYSQTAAIWRKSVLQKIHELGPNLHIGPKGVTDGHFEVEANKICKNLNLQGVVAYNNEPMRGEYHYDSCVFPYIASAVVKGKWNLKEYSKELFPLLLTHKINISERGLF